MNQLTALYSAIGNSLSITPEQRAGLIEVTLARLLAFKLPLPSEQVDSSSSYFASNCSAMIRIKVSEFNEQFPINIVSVMGMVRSFWDWRYTVLHPKNDDIAALIKMAAFATDYNSLKAALPPVYIAALQGDLPVEAKVIVEQFVAG